MLVSIMTRPRPPKNQHGTPKAGLVMTLTYFDALCSFLRDSRFMRFSRSVYSKSRITYMGVILPASPSTCTDPEGAILDPESSCSSVDLPAPESETHEKISCIVKVAGLGHL